MCECLLMTSIRVSTVSRRASIGLMGGAFALAATRRAGAADAITLRFSASSPPSDFLSLAMVTFKNEVERTTGGRITVETYPGNVLFRQGTEIPAIQRGTLQMSTGQTFELAEQVPQYGLFDRAYLLRDYAHLRKVFDGPIGAAYKAAIISKVGVRILAVAYLGTRQVALRVARHVDGPKDLSGVKLRVPAGPEWQLLGTALGTSPTPMGMPSVYLGLQTGTIDGEENPLTILSAAKLYEVTKQVVLTSHMVQPVFFDIGEPVWQQFTKADQDAVMRAAAVAQKQNDTARLADEQSVLADLKSRGLTVTTPDLAAFRANADRVYAEAEAQWDRPVLNQIRSLAS
jgi:tripartite ATP-independent transporter DctP family solute receptor